MKRLAMTRAAHGFAAALALLACACGPAHAGSLTVRETRSVWSVVEDPQADTSDFLLRHLVNGTRADERFGREGQTAFTLNPNNDPPASVRVDATGRIWMVGASLAGNQPQPVIARFTADGNADVRWGVQGKLQLTPAGIAIKPNDLLPLADGSVLVAGEVTGVATPRAVVFHLDANGALDHAFGSGGVWQRAGDAADSSTATSLAASSDGLVAVAVAVRGAKPVAELWSLTDVAPAVLQSHPVDDAGDGEDLRGEWATDHWTLGNNAGPTRAVPATASLASHPQASPLAAAASDPGEGAFSPFTTEAASAPAAEPADDGLPWKTIAIAVVLLASIAAAFAMRARKPKTVLRKPPGY